MYEAIPKTPRMQSPAVAAIANNFIAGHLPAFKATDESNMGRIAELCGHPRLTLQGFVENLLSVLTASSARILAEVASIRLDGPTIP